MTTQQVFLLLIALVAICGTGAYSAYGNESVAILLGCITGVSVLGACLPENLPF